MGPERLLVREEEWKMERVNDRKKERKKERGMIGDGHREVCAIFALRSRSRRGQRGRRGEEEERRGEERRRRSERKRKRDVQRAKS